MSWTTTASDEITFLICYLGFCFTRMTTLDNPRITIFAQFLVTARFRIITKIVTEAANSWSWTDVHINLHELSRAAWLAKLPPLCRSLQPSCNSEPAIFLQADLFCGLPTQFWVAAFDNTGLTLMLHALFPYAASQHYHDCSRLHTGRSLHSRNSAQFFWQREIPACFLQLLSGAGFAQPRPTYTCSQHRRISPLGDWQGGHTR